PDKLAGLDTALAAIAHVTPEVAARVTGIEAEAIRRLAREFAAASSAVCYGRLGTTVQAFGTLCQWLTQLLNIVTGNLDREGGALPTQPLIPLTGAGTRPGHYAQWKSRVSGLPEAGGELPVAALAEEVLTAGEGQIRALVTVCGNPVLSTPNGRQLDQALASLDFMVSIDIYINETTRHADLILPPTSSLNHDHYDTIFNAFAVRDVARYNQAIWARADDERYDWEILQGLAARLAALMGREFKPLPSTAEVIGAALCRGEGRHGMSLAKLMAAPHGVDLGALKPSLYQRLETADGKVQCAPAEVLADLPRFDRMLAAMPSTDLLLIGRRHVRSNNSWMHNAHRLVKGKARDQLLMHPDDLAARGLQDGQVVEVSSRVGSVQIAVEASPAMMPGVVSLPHGFGHNRPGTRLGIAAQHAGVSYNDLSDERWIDAVSGNAALNGVAVTVKAA
ncbi:MAG: molybdopterin oxidoreductase family protein, partial [Betaproteobacteria bacterium]|nr:molybdopterin oxidoreductase family protein [Betaproteobacteria bacterium]